MVFRRPHPTKFDMSDPLDSIAQELAAKPHGVIFTGKLSFENHVERITYALPAVGRAAYQTVTRTFGCFS